MHPYQAFMILSRYFDLFPRLVWIRTHLHEASASMLQLVCDNASDTGLIENNKDTPESGFNPFLIDSIVCNENSITSIIAELSQHWCWRLV